MRFVGGEEESQKIDDAVLGLLFLTSFKDHGCIAAWKGHDWDALNWLHECDPVGKAKSVVLTEEGEAKSREIFERLFCTEG